jgi:hypothetical protein
MMDMPALDGFAGFTSASLIVRFLRVLLHRRRIDPLSAHSGSGFCAYLLFLLPLPAAAFAASPHAVLHRSFCCAWFIAAALRFCLLPPHNGCLVPLFLRTARGLL